MDMDWCLTCERHLDAHSPAPYCSKPCRPQPGPSRFPSYHGYSYYDTYPSDSDSQESYYAEEGADEGVFYHEIADVPTLSYTANGDYSRIVAWANNVVPGAPADPAHHTPASSSASSIRTRCSSPQTTASSSRASSRSRRSSNLQSPTKTISPSTLLPPALLSASVRRPLAPALSFTPTHQTKSSKPSRPLNTSHLPPTAYSSSNDAYAHSSRTASTASTAQDSSALATPASGVGVGAAFLDQVLSWVAPPSPMRSVPQSPIEKKLTEKPVPPHLYSRGRRSGRVVA